MVNSTMPVIIYLLSHSDCSTCVQIHKSVLGGELLNNMVEIVISSINPLQFKGENCGKL